MSRKKCTGCGETKGVAEFNRDRGQKDGLYPRCMTCRRQYREENREAIAERKRRYRSKNREAILESERRYREENREAILERRRRYCEENRESERRYREKNRELHNWYSSQYQERNREAVNRYNRRYHEKSQMITAGTATRSGEPYTPAEDSYMLSSNEPIVVMAVELGRTYASVKSRLHFLRNKAAA